LTAPLAAKAVDDTAFYGYRRLLSRTDVGFDAGVLGLDAQSYHGLMKERADLAPQSRLTTATHDDKRGEDIRAHLAVACSG
jgi:(1->4)-alpha-D-glucan 1-alpha-D-glucosylmutase